LHNTIERASASNATLLEVLRQVVQVIVQHRAATQGDDLTLLVLERRATTTSMSRRLRPLSPF